ncbi:MAG: hypothetical protein LBE76_05055 [Nitrososphaerota archaeon]|nr:hypothetical protein [Nitrososphaerota archaeon]
MVESCTAPVTTPANHSAAPEVSVEIQKTPVWIPLVELTDPYTGEVIESYPGYYTTTGVVEITIKNRPSPLYNDTLHRNDIYYCVFMKIATHVWDPNPFPNPVVYQTVDSDYTLITLKYDERLNADWDILIGYIEDTAYDFRIQAVEGYFYLDMNDPNAWRNAVFEGVGSAFTEFTITIPARAKPGTIKPSIPSPTIAPSTSNSSNLPQSPQQLYLMIIIASVCIIAILLTVIAYQHKQRKNQPTQTQTTSTS